jgi:hypothetical protein
MRRQQLLAVLGVVGVVTLVVAYVFVPALQGRPLVLAAALGIAGLLMIVAAVGATLPPRVRSLLGWGIFAACPIGLLLWIFLVGIPPGIGAIAVGTVLCITALAGLVLAVREVGA